MGKAPSEKHLENYLWEHPEALDCEWTNPNWRPVARQYPLPSGRPDIIGVINCEYSGPQLVVVELKKGAIKGAVIAQTLRYMRDCQSIMWRKFHHLYWHGGLNSEYQNRFLDSHNYAIHDFVKGIIIGHDLPDENFCKAGEASNIEFVTYEYVDGRYKLGWYVPDSIGISNNPANPPDEYDPFMNGPVAAACEVILSPRFQADAAADQYLDELEGGES